jgi:hypothetical protein
MPPGVLGLLPITDHSADKAQEQRPIPPDQRLEHLGSSSRNFRHQPLIAVVTAVRGLTLHADFPDWCPGRS